MDIGIFLGPFTAGCIAYVVAFFLTAQTTEFYQIVLAQGILLGISAGGACAFARLVRQLLSRVCALTRLPSRAHPVQSCSARRWPS